MRDELQLFDETRALTEAPERTDPRQLVLLPRGQALRLELWRQMQSEQEKTEAENAERLGCVIVWEHLEELGERQALAVCSAWCLMSVCNLVSPALWQVCHIIPFVFLNNDDSLRLGGAGRTADRQGRRQGLIDLSLAPLGFLGVPSVARLFVLNSDLNRLAIGWISKVKRQLLRGGHILVRMYGVLPPITGYTIDSVFTVEGDMRGQLVSGVSQDVGSFLRVPGRTLLELAISGNVLGQRPARGTNHRRRRSPS